MSDEPEQEEGQSEGWRRLNDLWFSTIAELDDMMCSADDARVRIEAAKVILEYFKSFGQSLNEPWIPSKPVHLDEDDDGDDD